MRIVAVTDLHGSHAALERILNHAGPADVTLLGGDITNFGSPDDAEKAVRVARASTTTVLGVTGNCDSPRIEGRLVELGVSLHHRGVILDGVGLHGLSAIPVWKPGMHQFTEDELAAALRRGYSQVAEATTHCVLAHVPPHGTSLDQVAAGRHAGSTALREFVERTAPCLVICGHIHESRGVEQLGPTTVVNCGFGAGGSYALAHVDEVVTVELRRAFGRGE